MPHPLRYTATDNTVRPIAWWALLLRVFRVARETHPGASPRTLWRITKLLARKMRWLGALRSWHSDARNPALSEMVHQRPSIMLAVSRPYINDSWPVPLRLDAIWQHYSLLSGSLAFLRFDPGARLCLATFSTEVMPLQIVLDKPNWIPCEGELALNLYSGEQRLYSLAFSLGTIDEQRSAYIGGLQGLGDAGALDIYRSLTHAVHGLRPRDLLLNAFRMLCAQLGVERIRAVSDQNSACRSSYFGKTIPASYDTAWTEHDGTPDGRGFYELSLPVSRRPAEAIPSRKRAQYRRRYQMFDDLEQQIRETVRQAQATAPESIATAQAAPRVPDDALR